MVEGIRKYKEKTPKKFDIEILRKENVKMLETVMTHHPDIPSYIGDLFAKTGPNQLMPDTRMAIAMGFSMGIAPENRSVLLAANQTFIEESRDTLKNFQHRYPLYDTNGKVKTYTEGKPQDEREKEKTIATKLLLALEKIGTSDISLEDAREKTALLTAQIYMAARGQLDRDKATIEERLKMIQIVIKKDMKHVRNKNGSFQSNLKRSLFSLLQILNSLNYLLLLILNFQKIVNL